MSHWPGPRLEHFLTDWWRLVHDGDMDEDSIRRCYAGQQILTAEQFAHLVALYEPCRDEIERLLAEQRGARGRRGGGTLARVA